MWLFSVTNAISDPLISKSTKKDSAKNEIYFSCDSSMEVVTQKEKEKMHAVEYCSVGQQQYDQEKCLKSYSTGFKDIVKCDWSQHTRPVLNDAGQKLKYYFSCDSTMEVVTQKEKENMRAVEYCSAGPQQYDQEKCLRSYSTGFKDIVKCTWSQHSRPEEM